MVPLSEGRRVASSVRRLAPDAAVDFRTYSGMGHSTCDEQVSDLRHFLQSVVASGPGQAAGEAPAAAAAAAESAAAKSPALERVELEALSAAELKAYLRGRGVPTADCFERNELLVRALETSGGSL